MKRTLLLFIVSGFSLLSTNLYSQKFSYGIKGGLSLSQFSGGSSEHPLLNSTNSRLGGEYGVYGEYHITPVFSFSLGLEYSAQGGINKFQSYPMPLWVGTVYDPHVYSNFTCDTKLNYVVIPFLARKSWKVNNKLDIYAGAGPFVGVLLNSVCKVSNTGDFYLDKDKTVKYTASSSNDLILSNPDFQALLNKINLGVSGIFGLSYKISKKEALFIEVGTNYGLTSIQNNHVNGSSKTFNQVIAVGYSFTFKDIYKNRFHRKIKNDVYK